MVTANTLNGLAEVLLNRGAYAEGVALLRESLAIRRKVAPHQRLEMAMILNAIAADDGRHGGRSPKRSPS